MTSLPARIVAAIRPGTDRSGGTAVSYRGRRGARDSQATYRGRRRGTRILGRSPGVGACGSALCPCSSCGGRSSEPFWLRRALPHLAGPHLVGRDCRRQQARVFRGCDRGTRTPASHSLEINLRYNQNTLEQGALAAIAWTALALVLPRSELILIPAMACLFVFGRISFWIGYLLHPLGRAFGMVLTMLPTVIAYGWLAWHALGA